MAGKKELVDQVAEQTGAPKAQADRMVSATLDAIAGFLAQGDTVTLPGFGTFRVSSTSERQGRNPRTGEPMTIAAGKRVGFSAGSKLSSSVKGGSGASES